MPWEWGVSDLWWPGSGSCLTYSSVFSPVILAPRDPPKRFQEWHVVMGVQGSALPSLGETGGLHVSLSCVTKLILPPMIIPF